MKRTIVGIVLTTALAAQSAYAGTYTFEADRGDINVIGGVGPGGSLYSGGHWSGTYKAMHEGERKERTGTYECVSTGQPPNNNLFSVHIACTMEDNKGSFTSVWGCNPVNEDGTSFNCIAGLHGRSGAYEGKSGAAGGALDGDKSKGAGIWRSN